MAKIVECAKVDPSSGCKHVVRAQTDEEVLKKAAEHAKQLAQATGNSALVSELDRCLELFRQQRTLRELYQSGQKPS